MTRILILSAAGLIALDALLGAACTQSGPQAGSPPFRVVEASIPEMREALEKGRLTSRELVSQYLIRVASYEHRLHAALAINPHALEEADQLDRERAQGKLRGPLHGIPVALKDDIHTTHLPTTGGALAFAGYVPPYEATLTTNLRDAGAIIIAKTGMTELANWIAGPPTPMPTFSTSPSRPPMQ
jgi:amidase